MSAGEFRLRVAYGKTGRLRFLSHLEVVHALERMVRRARLTYAVTQGFSPHMKIAFGPALPVGTGGEREYLDIWLQSYVPSSDILGRLREAAPEGLSPVEAWYVPAGSPSLTAALTIARYEVEVDKKGELDAGKVQAALEDLLRSGVLTVEQKGKQKVFDLARCVPEDARVTDRDGAVIIGLTVRMGPQGSLRPEALVISALKSVEIAVPDLRTTRLDTLIEEDEGVWSRPV